MNGKNTLFYKGISGFTARSHFDLLMKAAESPYRWWFETLRCSKDYWWVCKQRGKTLDPSLQNVWKAFGDVFQMEFDEWWIRKGYALFQEQVAPPRVELVNDMTVREHLRNPKRQLLSIPLDISKQTLRRQLYELLMELGPQEIRKGDAPFKLLKIKGVRVKVLESAVRVWHMRFKLDYEMLHRSSFLDAQKLSLYDIGAELNISPQHKRKPGEPMTARILKERVMRVAVIRMTKRADALIANAEIGRFPSYESVTARKRWSAEQRKALEKAVADGKWCAPGVSRIDWDKLRQRYVRGAIW